MIPWLAAFAFTQAVEGPIYAFALRDRPCIPRLAVALGASTLTHPLVWFASPHLPLAYVGRVAVAEVGAVLVEAAWLALFHVRRPLAWSLLANAASLTLGLASRAAFGWP